MSDKTHQPNSKNSQNPPKQKKQTFNHRFGNIQTEHLTERERETLFLIESLDFPSDSLGEKERGVAGLEASALILGLPSSVSLFT